MTDIQSVNQTINTSELTIAQKFAEKYLEQNKLQLETNLKILVSCIIDNCKLFISKNPLSKNYIVKYNEYPELIEHEILRKMIRNTLSNHPYGFVIKDYSEHCCNWLEDCSKASCIMNAGFSMEWIN